MDQPTSSSTGSLPAFVIVIFVIVGILAVVLAAYLLFQRRNSTGYSRLTKRNQATVGPNRPEGGVDFHAAPANQRPPSHIPLQPYVGYRPSISSMGAPSQSTRDPGPESQGLLSSDQLHSSSTLEALMREQQDLMLELHQLTTTRLRPTLPERDRIAVIQTRLHQLSSASSQPETSYQPQASYHPQASYQPQATPYHPKVASYHPQGSYQQQAASYHPQASYRQPESYKPQTSYPPASHFQIHDGPSAMNQDGKG